MDQQLYTYKQRVPLWQRVRIQVSLTPERDPIGLTIHILCLLALTAAFGFFSARIDGDPESCRVANEETANIKDPDVQDSVYETMPNVINVGANFRLMFDVLFYAGCSLLIFHSMKVLGVVKSSEEEELSNCARCVLLAYYLMVVCSQAVMIGALTLAFRFRFIHSGRVCSGDFLGY